MSLRFKSAADLPPAMRAQVEGAKVAGYTPPQPAPWAKKKPARNKYGAQRCVREDGKVFDSKWERQRFEELERMQASGLIHSLEHHRVFALHVTGIDGRQVRIGEYECDACYMRGAAHVERGVFVVEDAKSRWTKTPLYEWKRKHLAAEWGIEIVEVERAPYRRKRG